MNIAFLFGAGVSMPAKMPSTRKLTKEILCDYDKWCKSINTGERYQTIESFKKNRINTAPEPKSLIEIGNHIHKVRSLLIKSYEDESDITYEHIYDALNQIHGHLSENYKNPLIEPFIKDLEEICDYGVDSLSVQSMEFIEDVVRLRLQLDEKKAELSPLLKIINTKYFDKIHIFTLNFDTLIEEFLKDNKKDYCDGFTLPLYNNQVKLWQEEALMNDNIGIKLYKLHGSLDWVHIIGGKYHYQFAKIINKMENYPYFEFNGEDRVYARDVELIGITNKLLSYTYGIYLDLISLFNLNLKKCNTLIISGYSFGDYGINLRISDWMSRSEDSRIIFIDPSPDNTLKKASGAIYSQFQNWVVASKMEIVKCKFHNWNYMQSAIIKGRILKN